MPFGYRCGVLAVLVAAVPGCGPRPERAVRPVWDSAPPAGDRAASRAACAEADQALRDGRIPEAKSAWERASRLDPSDPQPYAGRGQFEWAQRRFRAAAESIDQALRRDPKNVDLILLLIQTRREAGSEENTESLARRAVTLAPDNPKALVFLARYLATLSAAPGAKQEARTLLDRAVKLVPGMPIPLVEIGRLLHAEGRTTESLGCLEAAWNLLHRTPRALQQLESMSELEKARAQTAYLTAVNYRAQRDRANADRWFKVFRAVDSRIDRRGRLMLLTLKNPPDRAALLDLAEMDQQTGGYLEAGPLLRQALAIWPNDPRAKALAIRQQRLGMEQPGG